MIQSHCMAYQVFMGGIYKTRTDSNNNKNTMNYSDEAWMNKTFFPQRKKMREELTNSPYKTIF